MTLSDTIDTSIDTILDTGTYPIHTSEFQSRCKRDLDRDGTLVMRGFMRPEAVASVQLEGVANADKVYAKTQTHNVYLTPPDPQFNADHARNREVESSKGCITDDLLPDKSALRGLYDSEVFKTFLCAVLGEQALHPYADPLSSINLHFAKAGQELGWHFDNSSFAITLMIQAPDAGGQFEYVANLRDADSGDMNFAGVDKVLDGETPVRTLEMAPGTLVLFRGRNSLHRVAPVEGDKTRMLVVLAYNSQPGISLSESARMTFYGRLN